MCVCVRAHEGQTKVHTARLKGRALSTSHFFTSPSHPLNACREKETSVRRKDEGVTSRRDCGDNSPPHGSFLTLLALLVMGPRMRHRGRRTRRLGNERLRAILAVVCHRQSSDGALRGTLSLHTKELLLYVHVIPPFTYDCTYIPALTREAPGHCGRHGVHAG